MSIVTKIKATVAAVILAATLPVTVTAGDMAEKDIVDTAASAGDFNTLVTAIQEAGLVETLKGEGPFTVFAPTDEAFAKIPEDQLNALLADKEQLTAVLTYHVVAGKVMAADVAGTTATIQGKSSTPAPTCVEQPSATLSQHTTLNY